MPSMPPKKCYVVFNKKGDQRAFVEANDTTHAVLIASTAFRMNAGDVQEVSRDISEEEFNRIEPRNEQIRNEQICNESSMQSGEFFPDRLLIISGILLVAFFALIYDVGNGGIVNLHKLQNRNIGCAVGLVLASVGAIRTAIANNSRKSRNND